jgi:S-methylmethionine-dependent homocysteine/selenocysteine methylase
VGAPWLERLGGIRANASKMSHAELDESEVLDEGDPAELAGDYLGLRPRLPAVNVVGGCCGTDHRHIAAIASAWLEN